MQQLMKLVAAFSVLAVALHATGNALAEPPQRGLILWLDAADVDADGDPANTPASGTAIESWRDKSDRENHVAQDEQQRRPTFVSNAWAERPAVRFDGGDLLDRAAFEGLALGDRMFHALIVMRAPSGSKHTAQRLLDLNSRDAGAKDFPKRTGFWVGIQQGRQKTCFGIHHGDEGEGLTNAWNGEPNLVEAVYTGEQTFAIHRNGRRDQRALFNGTHFLGFRSNVTLALGQHFGMESSENTFFEGDIAEVLLYDRPLSATERYEIGKYLEQKHALKTEFRPIPQFEQDVQPILAKHCHACHADDPQEADLDLRTVSSMLRGGQAGPVIVRGFPDRSELVTMIEADKMPPEGETRLTADELRTLRDWVDADAPSAEKLDLRVKDTEISEEQRAHWAYQMLGEHRPPKISDTHQAANDVDRFILAKLQEKGLSHSPAADRATLIRRASFDLTGLPPTPEEVDAFISDQRPDAYEKLIDRLLTSPHFGERWGRHWLDVVGYVDMFGSDNDFAIIKTLNSKWRYRDYAIRSFNQDKPFARFIVEQLAGDELYDWRAAEEFTPEIREALIATGFMINANDDTDQNELNTPDTRHHVLQRTTELVANNLLALTLQCAKCHDHKYDAIPQSDYYRMEAIFAPIYNVRHWIVSTGHARADVPDAIHAEIDQHNKSIDEKVAELRKRHAEIQQISRQKVFDDKLALIDGAIREQVKTALATPADKRDEAQQALAAKHEAALTVTQQEIDAALDEPQRSEIAKIVDQINKENGRKRHYNTIQVLYERHAPPPTYVLRRGNYLRPGLEVEPGLLSIFGPPPETSAAAAGSSSGRRLALARQLTNKDTLAGQYVARVFVNRLWQQVFGRGIVASSENFGVSGSPPTHPELLDWLTGEFLKNGGHVKPIIKLMMMSRTYQQSSAVGNRHKDAERTDPGNQFLWRMNLRRLDSEYVRDSILAAGGKLDRTLFGEFIPLDVRPDGMVVIKRDELPTPTYQWRRSIYVMARRNYHLTVLRIFDQPIVARNCTVRQPSAVVTQALTLMHDDFVLEQAAFFAQRISSAGTTAGRIADAYQIALGRPPTAEETQWCAELIAKQRQRFLEDEKTKDNAEQLALAQFCKVLFNTNEFLYIR